MKSAITSELNGITSVHTKKFKIVAAISLLCYVKVKAKHADILKKCLSDEITLKLDDKCYKLLTYAITGSGNLQMFFLEKHEL